MLEQASAFYVTAFQGRIMSGSVVGSLVYAHIGVAAVLATTAAMFALTRVGVLACGHAFRSVPTIGSSPLRASADPQGLR